MTTTTTTTSNKPQQRARARLLCLADSVGKLVPYLGVAAATIRLAGSTGALLCFDCITCEGWLVVLFMLTARLPLANNPLERLGFRLTLGGLVCAFAC